VKRTSGERETLGVEDGEEERVSTSLINQMKEVRFGEELERERASRRGLTRSTFHANEFESKV